MVYCSHCGDHCPSIVDPDKGYICCGMCGKIIDQEIYSTEPTFVKDSSGQSRLGGMILRSIESGYSASHERTLAKGRDEIRYIVNCLDVAGGDSIIDEAHKFYQIAVDKNFTRGRRTTHVAAACLYIACRKNKKAYLLIDFSDYLQVNVYVLGAVFLQLCKVLQLSEHPIIQKLVDPSLFIHRFTERLLGKKNNEVSTTALRIIASMKRDWMQTGRKPSGLCGAALYIAALSQGLDYSKSEIVNVVHVCEATLTKRLIEFENTESGCLTIEEFTDRADELEKEMTQSISMQLPKDGGLLCKHKEQNDIVHFAHGLCKKCFEKFMKLSGGVDGGAEPPAFQRAEMKRKKAEAQIEESSSNFSIFDEESGPTVQEKNTDGIGFSLDELQEETQASGVTDKEGLESDVLLDDEVDKEDDEPETLSDIDDAEVNEYLLHDEEEKHYKRIIWEEMNKEYLEELALKEAAKKEAEEREPRKVRKRKPDEDDTGPAKTPFEATCNVLKKKGLASKVNLDAIGSLYDMDDITFEKEEAETEEKTFNKFAEFEENAENGLDEFDFVDEFVFD
ncbi:transcription factor 3B subunit-like isoform X1 [Carex littledalei]|uniref:Transcription factor 3B subunit-like isoform X1 n=1 Tax=Carex littledalei TaxID=544730 RepID=A0A833RMF3_9POAL|nr:transcription factor 3B subunit-like isoform X1 [Carex littledalei]